MLYGKYSSFYSLNNFLQQSCFLLRFVESLGRFSVAWTVLTLIALVGLLLTEHIKASRLFKLLLPAVKSWQAL